MNDLDRAEGGMEYAINFFGLNIAVSGMSTYNAGLTTTGHNISNVKTKGYSRQTVEQSAKEVVCCAPATECWVQV